MQMQLHTHAYALPDKAEKHQLLVQISMVRGHDAAQVAHIADSLDRKRIPWTPGGQGVRRWARRTTTHIWRL